MTCPFKIPIERIEDIRDCDPGSQSYGYGLEQKHF